MPRRALLPLVVAGVGILACGEVPRDPESTLDHARGGVLRVGASEAPPWVTGTEGPPGGLEAELVREFAGSIDAEVKWVRGAPEEHLEALEKFELDLVVAGLTTASPWKTRVGLTRPYLKERWLVGVPPGTASPPELEGLEVAVPESGPAAAWVKEKGARPGPVVDLEKAGGPVAAPEWKLREMGYVATEHHLHTVEHVLAAPPGENGLIVRLETLLHELRRRDRLEAARR